MISIGTKYKKINLRLNKEAFIFLACDPYNQKISPSQITSQNLILTKNELFVFYLLIKCTNQI